MRRLMLLALPLLSACMGGSPEMVLSGHEVTDRPGGDLVGNPPSDDFVGDVSFSLLLNDARVEGGVTVLTQNAALTAAAGDHAYDMVTNDYLSHTGLDGSSPGDRASAAGYNWNYISENIAAGFKTEEGVMNGWMESEGHKENILDPRAEDFGIAQVGDTWVLMLGSEF